MGNPFGRSVILPLTNQSGGSVAAGDVVYLDTAHDDSFTTGTTSAYTGGIGIAQQAIGAGSVGLVLVQGYASLVNVNASVTRGDYGKTYTVAKQATDAGADRVAGAFCQFLKGGTTPDAMVWQPDLGAGSGMTNPMTTTGDMVYSSSGSTPARLAAVATGKVLLSQGTSTAPAWGYPPLHGVMLRRGTTSAFGSGSYAAVTWDTEEWDTDSYHDAVSNTSRITIGTGLGGKYLVTVNAYSAQAGTWVIRKNGSDYTKTAYTRTVSDGAGNNLACIAYPMLLSDSDYIECMTNQSSGNLETSANGFGALRIG